MRSNGHMDTMSICGIYSDVLPGAQAEAYPPDGAYSFEGYPVKTGQVIRLHSEYQNNSGAPKTDVMGIMAPWPRLPRWRLPPSQVREPGAGFAGAGLQPVHEREPHPRPAARAPLLQPARESSGQLTVGSPDANGAAANSVGTARMSVILGNPATAADEADVKYRLNLTDVRKKSDLTDYTGQVQLKTPLRILDRYNGPSEVGGARTPSSPSRCPAPPPA